MNDKVTSALRGNPSMISASTQPKLNRVLSQVVTTIDSGQAVKATSSTDSALLGGGGDLAPDPGGDTPADNSDAADSCQILQTGQPVDPCDNPGDPECDPGCDPESDPECVFDPVDPPPSDPGGGGGEDPPADPGSDPNRGSDYYGFLE